MFLLGWSFRLEKTLWSPAWGDGQAASILGTELEKGPGGLTLISSYSVLCPLGP